ncbi:heme biosynthesis HemY N-terminal domain-containing protein [Pseudomonas benzenivorans]|uniref:Tetratricopeptide repeat protein n=1 Tax=Pseudomonas benzenivorans TaxID=556533 RepID=A0ABY5HFH3_9PSED|nr:heme biosynthesis HemY N-terminal domain-containing protein [Pseudomonas benzenivorans]UTW09741.1 tetratricopeptide repeat protein [Pseudomonas benzenivorans]
MKRVALLLAVLLVVAGLGLLGMAIVEHKGYVLFAYQGFRYESSLWAFLGLLLALWLLIRLLRLVLGVLVTSGRLINPWSRLHRSRRVRVASEQGFVDLAEGRWVPALRYLRRAAESDPQPLMYYLSAARAAHKLGQHEDSDALLERALKRQPDAELAIALTHARLQQDRGQRDAARETLEIMRERYPQHSQVLRQLQRLYLQAGDWSALLGLLPELRKQKVLGAAELAELERQAWHGRLATAGQPVGSDAQGALAALTQSWEQLSSGQRQDPQLLAVYAEQLRVLGAEREAEELLHHALKRNYDSRLVRLYGLLRGQDPARQLQAAEGWLKQHPQDAGLLLTVGRLCLQNQLWGKAKEYFESSLIFQRDPETCAELARLLARLGEVERSNQLFQEGLGLLDQRLGGLPLPQPAIQ